MIYDLNVNWPCNQFQKQPNETQLLSLVNTISTLYFFGCYHVVINFRIEDNLQIPTKKHDVNPIQIESIKKRLPENEFQKLKLFTRLTLILSNVEKMHKFSKIFDQFDVIALEPTSENVLSFCQNKLEIDLITFNMQKKIPFFLKSKTMETIIKKGIYIELCYSAVISGQSEYKYQIEPIKDKDIKLDSTAYLTRKRFFYNAFQIIRSTRSKGLVVSSGSFEPLQTRSTHDVLVLLKTLGLNKSKSKLCVTSNPEMVLLKSQLRKKSFKHVVCIGNDEKNCDVLKMEFEKFKPNLISYKRSSENTAVDLIIKKHKTS